MKDNPIQIFYDMQQNQYYRIDKQTGVTERSFKNGHKQKKFLIQITGQDYKARKNKTLNVKNPEQTSSKQKVKYNKINKNIATLSNPILRYPINTKNLQKKVPKEIKQYEQNKSLDINTIINKKDQLITEQTLHTYQLMKQKIIYQNNSIIKGIQGTNPKKKVPSFRQTILSKQLSLPQINKINLKSSRQKNNKIGIIQVGEISNKLKRQKQIFLKYHPYLILRQKQDLIKQMIDRKKNLKILQQEFISLNNSLTKNVYTKQQ